MIENTFLYEAWILHRARKVLVQPDGFGVPAAAVVQSDGTVGGTYFEKSSYIEPAPDDEMVEYARKEAARLGYELDVFDPRFDWVDEDD